MSDTAENDAPTYSREDMARAWDKGFREGAIAAKGLDALDNPYLVIPPGGSDG